MSQIFDGYAETYRATVQRSIAFSGLDHEFFLRAKTAILSDIFQRRLGRKPALLDVGCGIGAMHGHMAGIVDTLAGADPSAEALRKVEAAHPAAAYRAIEGGVLPWGADGFDAATAICVFHHVAVADRPALVREMARVVRPGGLVAIIEHNPFNPLARLAVAGCPFDDDAVLLRPRETRDLLAAAGIRQIATEHFLLFPSSAGLARGAERLLRRVPAGAQFVTFGTVR